VAAVRVQEERILEDCPTQNRRFWLLSALRAHTKLPYKTNLLW
jgi:hypothetical protein